MPVPAPLCYFAALLRRVFTTPSCNLTAKAFIDLMGSPFFHLSW